MQKNNNQRIIFFILFMVPIAQLGIDIYLPSFPSMSRSLGITPSLTKLSLTVYIFTCGFSQLLCGSLSDQFGRRPILFIGTALGLIGSGLCLAAHSGSSLLWGRALQGLGAGAPAAIVNAITGDVFQGTQLKRVTSYNTITYSLTPILAPYLGGIIETYTSWRGNFLFLFAYSLVVLLVAYRYLPETVKNSSANKRFSLLGLIKQYRKVLGSRSFKLLSASMSLCFAIIIVFNVLSPFILQERLHQTPYAYGSTVLFMGLAYTLGNLTTSSLLERIRIEALIYTGSALLLCISIVQLLLFKAGVVSVFSVISTMFMMVYASGLIFPNCMARTIGLFPENAGTAAALMGFIILLGCTIVSYAAALPIAHHILALPILLIICASLNSLTVIFALS